MSNAMQRTDVNTKLSSSCIIGVEEELRLLAPEGPTAQHVKDVRGINSDALTSACLCRFAAFGDAESQTGFGGAISVGDEDGVLNAELEELHAAQVAVEAERESVCFIGRACSSHLDLHADEKFRSFRTTFSMHVNAVPSLEASPCSRHGSRHLGPDVLQAVHEAVANPRSGLIMIGLYAQVSRDSAIAGDGADHVDLVLQSVEQEATDLWKVAMKPSSVHNRVDHQRLDG